MRRIWTFRIFDLTELCCVVLLTGACALNFGRSIGARSNYAEQSAALEAARLRATYGPGKFSQGQEEWIIRDFFKDRVKGFFVDVGANDYKRFSTTYYLDVVLGWSGLCVEPLKMFEPDYKKHRPRSRFLPFFVSDVSSGKATMFFRESDPAVTSAYKGWADPRWFSRMSEVTVPTITLNDLLAQEKVDQIDFLSMDIELSEPKALAGFDLERYRPALVCIEASPPVVQQILDYFAGHRYVAIGRYLRVDTQNLYFTPLK